MQGRSAQEPLFGNLALFLALVPFIRPAFHLPVPLAVSMPSVLAGLLLSLIGLARDPQKTCARLALCLAGLWVLYWCLFPGVAIDGL